MPTEEFSQCADRIAELTMKWPDKPHSVPRRFRIHIMKNVMDKVIYGNTEEGNRIVLTKHLPNRHVQDGSI
jgi:hypothetical protein